MSNTHGGNEAPSRGSRSADPETPASARPYTASRRASASLRSASLPGDTEPLRFLFDFLFIISSREGDFLPRICQLTAKRDAVHLTSRSFCPSTPPGNPNTSTPASTPRDLTREPVTPVLRFVEREIRVFRLRRVGLRFLRGHCDGCGRVRLVAFSCKGAGSARGRGSEVDPHALPDLFRLPCVGDAKLTSAVLRAVFTDPRRTIAALLGLAARGRRRSAGHAHGFTASRRGPRSRHRAAATRAAHPPRTGTASAVG